MNVLELAQALIRLPSVTPEEGGCLALIGERLARLGFTLERLDAGGVANLWARRGEEGPLFVFAGHVDVVPPGPEDRWRFPPFSATVAEGRLYGRGAADMKSSLAAMVWAVEAFLAERPSHGGSIGFLLTSDEEGPAVHGTRHVVEVLRSRGLRFDYALVGEPTCERVLGDTIKNGRRGSLTGRLTVHGKQGHVAYPHLVDNPVHRLAPALAELVATEWDRGNEHFPPTSLQVTDLHAGVGATNVVPGECRMAFNFRFSSEQTPEGLQERVEAMLRRHGVPFSLAWELGGRPFLTPRGELITALSESIEAACGIAPRLSTSGGTSDGRFIAAICPEVVEFGPVNASIHQIDESVAIDELEPLAASYRGVLERLLPPAGEAHARS
ncbi:MAG: succinyl-diaminopimelate desuccinylase [Tepidiphilus sp.]|nr:succinyl-diaminopimelate desuccinylase [Tepidiphilus sp.]MDD3433383.1 succinyl-diaminopimelate desuccinylase [Tepidiphilus sp.]